MAKHWTVVMASALLAAAVVIGIRYIGFASNTSSAKAIVSVSAALAALWIKIYMQKLIFGSITYYKQGWDFCIMTLGTSLTSAVGTSGTRLGALFAVFVLALLAVLVASDFAKTIEGNYATQSAPYLAKSQSAPPLQEGWRSLLSFSLGMLLFMINVGVLLTKD